MAQGVKCDEPTCTAFGELPVDPMGGFQPVGDWVEIRTTRGRYHACGPDHACLVVKKANEVVRNADAESEAHAVFINQQAEDLRRPADQPNGQVS